MEAIKITELSGSFQAYLTCKEKQNLEWKDRHEDKINEILERLPNGSGIDAGVKFDWENSTPEKLIFLFGFHHMDEQGGYDGWTEHKLIITPSLQFSYNIKITGKDRNFIKGYLYDLFSEIFY